jgi:hypothetical protein
MALRDPEIPNHRDRSSLQLMNTETGLISDLYPGKGTIANLAKKGWIEQGVKILGAPDNFASRGR